MVSVTQAQDIVSGHASPLASEALPLDTSVLGLVLGEDITSDLDMPPYDKALMDGYAVRSSDLTEGKAALTVIEEITAGMIPKSAVGPGQASRIMTGAPIPAGADAVVMIERTRQTEANLVQVEDQFFKPSQNILRQGREMRAGQTVIQKNTVLRPQHFGVMATVGRTRAMLIPAPHVAVLSTGDEVVEPGQRPGPGQIRNGNGALLMAQVARAGGVPRFLGIARDQRESLLPLIEEGLRSSILVLSGGVSAGKLDLVPGVLAEAGVTAHFHKVEMKPGKPVLFGTKGRTLVFGLPGNPVGALVCFELLVRTAIRGLRGHAETRPRALKAGLKKDFTYRTDRPTYYPAVLEFEAEGPKVSPLPWFGSADLLGVAGSNSLVLLPPGDHKHLAGQQFDVLVTDW